MTGPVSPVSIRTGLAIAIAAGTKHTCALIASGTIRCWGDNSAGQLGDGTTTERLAAVQVFGITTAVAIAAGGDHSCAVLVDATVRCWGRPASPVLGR